MNWHTADPRACANIRSPVQDQGGRGVGPVSGSILAQQDLVPGTYAPRDSPSLADSSEEGSTFTLWHTVESPLPRGVIVTFTRVK